MTFFRERNGNESARRGERTERLRLVVVSPGIIVALTYFDNLPPLPMTLYPTYVTAPSVLIAYFVYWAVINLSFRAGIGRARGGRLDRDRLDCPLMAGTSHPGISQ